MNGLALTRRPFSLPPVVLPSRQIRLLRLPGHGLLRARWVVGASLATLLVARSRAIRSRARHACCLLSLGLPAAGGRPAGAPL
eukprot:13572118-Alexandrium_andersonii.AAC.1